MLNACARQVIYKIEQDYVEAPAEYHARWRGEGVHAMAEHGGPFPGVIQERRIRKQFVLDDGFVFDITGQPDWWDVDHRHISDWKSTKVAPNEPYEDHDRQVNVYAWLLDGGTWDDTGEVNTVTALTADITYIDPMRSRIIPIPLWTDDAITRMLQRKLQPFADHRRSGTVPEAIPFGSEEFWKTRYCPFFGTESCCGDVERV